MPNLVNPDKPVYLPISYADNYVGKLILGNYGVIGPVKREVFGRILSVTLPFFHLIDAIRYECYYLHAKMKGKKWIVKNEQICLSIDKYTQVRNQHLWAIFTSAFKGLINPASAVGFFAKHAEMTIPEKAITYELFPHSRLGDNVACYFNAKWAAYKMGLPLILKPFPHWNELKLSDKSPYTLPNGLYNNVPVTQLEGSFDAQAMEKIEKAEKGLFETPFMFTGNIDWSDEKFCQSAVDDLMAITGDVPYAPKENYVNVALHYRDGGDFDFQHEKYLMPAKFPCEDYYKGQIKFVLEKYKGQNVHFQIFTDSTNPQSVKKMFEDFEKSLPQDENRDVSFGCVESNDHSDHRTVSEMVQMSKYDCLIRPASGLSRLAGLMGSPKLEIYPTQASMRENQDGSGLTTSIEKVAVVTRDTKPENIEVLSTNFEKKFGSIGLRLKLLLKRLGIIKRLGN